MPFTPAAFRFLRGLKANNAKPWFESHRQEYELQLRQPMVALVEEMDARFRRFAPEIGGNPRKSVFRIYRDVRFSRDKSPYKTHAACWFSHRHASHKVGSEAEGGGAGFYFQLEPGHCQVGAGIWMPPRPLLARIRDAIADNPRAFAKVVENPPFKRRYGGLDDEGGMLKRMPRGFPEDHPAARWLRYQSFTSGRKLKDSQVTGPRLGAVLEKEFVGLLPLVRWLNAAVGLKAQK